MRSRSCSPLSCCCCSAPGLSLTVNDLPIVVQDFDGSSASNNFIDAFRASITFHVVAWPVDKSAEEALSSNAARAVLIIPPHFGRDLARGVNSPVQLMMDASDANTAKLVAGDATQIAAAYNQQISAAAAAGGPVQDIHAPVVQPRPLLEKVLRPRSLRPWHLHVPAAARRARHGQRRRAEDHPPGLRLQHLRRTSSSSARSSPSWPSRSARAVIMASLLFTYFGLSLAGDPTPLIIATILYVFCVASFGTMIGATIPNQAAAMQAVALGGFLLVFLLSGLMFPIQNIPIGLRWISNFVWGRYYIEIVRDALLQGGGWPAVWYKVIFIGIIGAIFYTLAWRGMRKMQVKA